MVSSRRFVSVGVYDSQLALGMLSKSKIRFSVSITENWFYFFGIWLSNIFFPSFLSKKLHRNYQMSDKISSHICLMLSVYKGFHQTAKCGSRLLQDLTGL